MGDLSGVPSVESREDLLARAAKVLAPHDGWEDSEHVLHCGCIAPASRVESVPSISEVLQVHIPHIIFGAEWWAECLAPDCEWNESSDVDGDVQDAYRAHTAHLAAALTAREALVLAEGRAEAWDEGWNCGSDMDSSERNPYRRANAESEDR